MNLTIKLEFLRVAIISEIYFDLWFHFKLERNSFTLFLSFSIKKALELYHQKGNESNILVSKRKNLHPQIKIWRLLRSWIRLNAVNKTLFFRVCKVHLEVKGSPDPRGPRDRPEIREHPETGETLWEQLYFYNAVNLLISDAFWVLYTYYVIWLELRRLSMW